MPTTRRATLRRALMAALLACAALALAACDALGLGGPTPEPLLKADSPVLAADFGITAYGGDGVTPGQRLSLRELQARGKPVVLNFWAGQCPPCRDELPDFQAVHEARGDEVLLFGVDMGPYTGLGSEEDARALLEELAITMPTGLGEDFATLRDYAVVGMPTTVFITADGRLVGRRTGILGRRGLERLVDELVRIPRGGGR